MTCPPGLTPLTHNTRPIRPTQPIKKHKPKDIKLNTVLSDYRGKLGEIIDNLDILKLNSVGWEDVRNYPSLKIAVAAITPNQRTLLVSTPVHLAKPTTVPSHISLWVLQGGSFSGAKLTVNGNFEAGLYQVFKGGIEVSFGAGAVKEVYPEWWKTNTTPGTTDMLTALNSALSANDKVALHEFQSYAVSGQITISNNNRYLFGNNATLVITSALADAVIYITSNNVLVDSLEINGVDLARIGIKTTGSDTVKIQNCIIHDLLHATLTTFGIEIRTSTNIKIIGGEIYNISCTDTSSPNRGIVVGDATTNDILISGVTIHDVENYADGDLIQVASALNGTWSSLRATIENCTLYNFYKRAIKVQASDVIVKDNIIYNTTGVSDPGLGLNTSTAIGTFGSNNIIEGNNINLRIAVAGIMVETPSTNTIVSNNTIINNSAYDTPIVNGSSAAGITVGVTAIANKISIVNNIINTVGRGIKVGTATYLTISNNQITTDTSSYGIDLITAITGATIVGNSFINSAIGIVVRATSSDINIVGNSYYVGMYGIRLYDTALITLNIDTEFFDSTVGTKVYLASQAQGVRILNRIQGLEGSLVWDPVNLVDGAGETSGNITIQGVALGDYIMPSAPYDLQGITATAHVSANEVVNIRIENETGGAINLESGTWKVKAFK